MKPEIQKLFGNVLKYLGVRPRSRSEILTYLNSKTKDQEIVDQVISKLENSNLINDAEFARWLVESRSRHKPRGKRLIAHELKKKGISPELISQTTEATDEKASAKVALSKKLPLWTRLPPREYRIKATRFLASRGFSWSVIEEVVKIGYNSDDVN